MTKALAALPLLVLLAGPASADEIRGKVDHTSEPAPTAENPRNTVDVVTVTSGGTDYTITDPETVRTLYWFDHRDVVLEGSVGADGSFTVSQIVKPAFHRNLEGVLYKTKAGWGGAIRIDTGGDTLRAGGPTYLMMRTATKDLKRRVVSFQGYVFEERKEVVVTHLQATAKEELNLTEGVILGPIQDVPAGQTVWVRRRGLIGATSEIETNDGVVGRVLTSKLRFGTVEGEDAPASDATDPAPSGEAKAGAVQVLGRNE